MARNEPQAVLDYLTLAHGWHTDWLLPMVVYKDYLAAGGSERAWIRLDAKSNSEGVTVQGEFLSEGSNAAAECCCFIPVSARPDILGLTVDAFIEQLEHVIEETPSMRRLAHLAACSRRH